MLRLIRPALALAVLVALPAFGQDDAAKALVDRVRLIALDARCGLLSVGARAAVSSGRDLARGALLRGGIGADVIDDLARRAQAQAETVDCASEALLADVARAEDAYGAWSGLRAMSFPAARAQWVAERKPFAEGLHWLLRQDAEDGATSLGVIRPDDEARLAIGVVNGADVRSARLALRDASRLPEPLDAEWGATFADPSSATTTGLVTPDAYMRAFWASGRLAADPEAEAPGAVLMLPEAALEALAGLNPNEVVRVEIDRAPRSGPASVESVWFEVGDFAAALSFLGVEP